MMKVKTKKMADGGEVEQPRRIVARRPGDWQRMGENRPRADRPGMGLGRNNWQENMQRRIDMFTQKIADNPELKDKLTARIDHIKARMAARQSMEPSSTNDRDVGGSWRNKQYRNQGTEETGGNWFSRRGRTKNSDWHKNKDKTTPTTPNPTTPTPTTPPIVPASNKWSDIVNAYFPKTMKAGGVVKSGEKKMKRMNMGGMTPPPMAAAKGPSWKPAKPATGNYGQMVSAAAKAKAKPPVAMKKGGMVMRGAGCAVRGVKTSKKMG